MTDAIITDIILALAALILIGGLIHDAVWLVKNVGVALILLTGGVLGVLLFSGLVMIGG